MKFFSISLLLIACLSTPHLVSAKVYKCKTDNGVQYQSSPCATEDEKQRITNSHMLSSHRANENSLNEHIYSVDKTQKNWRCDTIEQAFESLPSRLSIAYILNDYAKMSKEQFAQRATVRYRKGQARGQVKIRSSYSRNPCTFTLRTSLRSNKKSISLNINSDHLYKAEDKQLSERRLVSLLKKNGYRLSGGSNRNGRTRYHYNWQNDGTRCNSSFQFGKDSADKISSIRFSNSCNVTPSL